MWDHWQESRTPFAIAAIDIDHFKAVNDAHGHAAGDEVLKVIASRMQMCLREGDINVRMGGEEFLFLLRNCTLDRAAVIATRAFDSIRNDPIHTSTIDLPVTVSVGVAAVNAGDSELNALCKRADAALYRAKGEGRDRIIVDHG